MTVNVANTPHLSLQSNGPVARALCNDDIRAIVRQNAQFISALIDTAPSHDITVNELALLIGRVLINEPQMLDAIVSHGLGSEPKVVAEMPLISKLLTAGKILDLTSKACDVQALGVLLREELFETTLLLSGTRH